MRQGSFFQIGIRLFAVIAYFVVTAAASAHVSDHEVDAPYDRVCALCKFSDQTPTLKPQSTNLILPENEQVTWVIALRSLSRIFLDSIGAIRAPPSFVTPL
ncbi:hypothetical protein [Kordiimonas sp.]|uniref:hypothetical protein n=1 Tax=Kordiimonas sp. TaxID=1970157 RepID=UPI003A952C04